MEFPQAVKMEMEYCISNDALGKLDVLGYLVLFFSIYFINKV